ncbi:MAG: PQQ-binding-like beta-propeller repeat protein [Candidatus Dormibacteria bacterium]
MRSRWARVGRVRGAQRLLPAVALAILPLAIVALVLSSLGHPGQTSRATPAATPAGSPSLCAAGSCLPEITPLPSPLPPSPIPLLPAPLPSLRVGPPLAPTAAPARTARVAGYWPMFGYDSTHSGANPQDVGLTAANLAQLRFAWSDGGGGAMPVVGDGHVVLPDAGFVGLFADPASCQTAPPYGACDQQWRVSKTGGDGFDGMFSAALVGGQIVVPDESGNVYVFSERPCGASHCLPRWSGQTAGDVSRAIALDAGSLFVGTGGNAFNSQRDERVYAFPVNGCGASNCSPTWTSRPDNPGDVSGVTAGGGLVYAADGRLKAYRSAGCGAPTCAAVWTSDFGPLGLPTFAGGMVYSTGLSGGTGAPQLFAFDARSGVAKWQVSLPGPKPAGGLDSPHPTVAGGSIYLVGTDARLHVFDAVSGSERWTAAAAAAATGTHGAPAVADGLVFAGLPTAGDGTGGGLAAYSAAGCGASSCSPLWVGHSPTGSGPQDVAAVSAGRVYGYGSGEVEVWALPGR